MRLTATDRARLSSTLRTLADPFSAAADRDWCREVNDRIKALVNAGQATFVLPDTHGGTALYSDELNPAAARAYADRYYRLDPGQALIRVEKTTVYSRRLFFEKHHVAFYRSEYYTDYVLPNRLHDSCVLLIPGAEPGPTVGIYAHQDRRRDLDYNRRVYQLLALVHPAFVAAVATRQTIGRHAARLAAFIDALADGVTVSDPAGRTLHVNQALTRLLAADSDAPRLDAAIAAMRRRVAALLHSVPAMLDDPSALRISDVVRTATATYQLSGSLVPSVTTGDRDAVAVTVSRRAAPVSAELLRVAFGLTPRECEVALLLARGDTNARIAAALGVTPHTARHHTEQVLAKLGVHTRSAVAAAIQQAPHSI